MGFQEDFGKENQDNKNILVTNLEKKDDAVQLENNLEIAVAKISQPKMEVNSNVEMSRRKLTTATDLFQSKRR